MLSFAIQMFCFFLFLFFYYFMLSCATLTYDVSSPTHSRQQQQARSGLLFFADETPNLATRRRNLCQMPGDVARIKALVYFWRWLILTPAAHRVHRTFISPLACCWFSSSRVSSSSSSSILLASFRCPALQWQVFKVKRPSDDASTAARREKVLFFYVRKNRNRDLHSHLRMRGNE